MRRPDPTWECDYAHNRRKHRHRCVCCKRIIDAGERVLMCRKRRGSIAVHIDCADNYHAHEDRGPTTRKVMHVWGLEALKMTGWNVSESEMQQARAAAE